MAHDIGTWGRKKQLTKEEIKARQESFLSLQSEYNKTGSKELLWKQLYPLILDCCKSAVIKVNGYNKNFIKNYDEKVEDAVYTIMNRYVKRQDYNFSSLVTLCYFAALGASRNKAIQNKDMEVSLTHLIDDTDWREQEHIIDWDESLSQSTTEIDGQVYCIEELY